MSLAGVEGYGKETHFLCDALIAATFSFFSAMRFAIRALKNVEHELREEEKGQNALVFRLLLLLMFEPANLKGTEMTTALKAQRCDQPLDLGSVKNASHISWPYLLSRV